MPEATPAATILAAPSTRADLIDWGLQPNALAGSSRSSGRLLHKGPGGIPEAGLWACTPGRWRLSIPGDEFCHFVAGRATYRSTTGETVEAAAGTLVLFPAGWTGECTVHEAIRTVYMLAGAGSGPEPARPGAMPPSVARAMRHPLAQTDLVDWGDIPTMIEGRSRTSGKLLHKGPDGHSECGLWVCTPGTWACHVTRDEFCHFLEGRCTYVHESGATIAIEPDTIAFFPQDWKGVCTVHRTVRKVYMIR